MLSAGVVNLTAGGEIGQPGALAQIDTAALTLNASAGDSSALPDHGIWIGNTGGMTVTNAATTDGVILIDVGAGNLSAVNVVANGAGRDVQLRTRFGLPGYGWTDAALIGVNVKAIHVTELRSALQEAYTRANGTTLTFTDPSVVQGRAIKAVHVQEIRDDVVALEAI